jgi:hypothetical protein
VSDCRRCGRPLDDSDAVWDDRTPCTGCRREEEECDCKPLRRGAPRGPSQADELLRLAEQAGWWWITCREDPYAVVPGDSIARALRGGRGSVRAELARVYAEAHGRAPSANALADVMLALEGRCYAGEERELHLRVARTPEAAWLDLGDADCEMIRITPGGWQAVPGGGPLFRRTRLTGALPKPARDGDLGALRVLLRVPDETWPLVVAWLVSVLLLPDLPVPVLALTGEHGTAKSWQSRLLVELADPSVSPLRTAPRDVESWAVAASASRVVALDNVSRIEPWLSDALCRAVTGDGMVRRALYTNSDVSVIAFRRAILINGITLRGMGNDLADRLLRAELDILPDTDRLDEADLTARWAQAHPLALGGLLDLAAAVLAALPGVRLDRLPRMADYARVLAAVDQVLGTDGLTAYLGQRRTLAAESVEDDPVAAAVAAMATQRAKSGAGPWEGTSAALLTALRPPDAGDDWPRTARGMTARLTRAAPALRATGTSIAMLPQPTTGHRQPRTWRVEEIAAERPQRTNVSAASESAGQGDDGPGDIAGTLEEPPGQRPANVPGVSAGREVGDVGDVAPPPLSPAVCDRCGEAHHRYGDGGRPCRTAPAEVGR